MSESVFTNYNFGRPIQTGSIGGLSDLRLIDLNLLYVIKEIILPINGYVNNITETIQPGQVIIDQDTNLPLTPYKSTYYDWCYYNPDPSNPSLTGLLTVPTLSQSGNLAYIDYPNGTVYYSGNLNNTITATYSYYPVYVQDGYPDFFEDIGNVSDSVRCPAISIDFLKRKNVPFALGGSFEKLRTFVINITAMSDPQRDNLLEIVLDSLKYTYANTINYSQGFPIDFNGSVNGGFDRTNRWEKIRFLNTTTEIVRSKNWEQEKFRHQANIFLTVSHIGSPRTPYSISSLVPAGDTAYYYGNSIYGNNTYGQ